MKLTDLLTQEGLVTPEQLEAALQEQRSNGDFLARILIKNGVLDEERLLDALSRQPGIVRIDLASVTLDPALTDHLSEELARKRGCLPIKLAGNMLTVGMIDPLDTSTIEFLAQQTEHTIKPAAIAPSAIEEGWRRLYGRAKEMGKAAAKAVGKGDAAAKLPSGKEIKELVNRAVQEISDAEIAKEERRPDKADAIPLEIGSDVPPIIRLSNLLLVKMIETDASDLHIEPQENCVRVRYRIDGALHELFSLPVSIRPALTSRFKIMSEMDVAEHRIPQDGRIKLALGDGRTIDFRINTLPGVFGEKLCARILGTGMLKGRIAELGFRQQDLENTENALMGYVGMILVTGPTGSGKTTTLYTMLNQLNTEDVNIVTAEDPVEYNLPGLHQVNVRPAIGFTFDTALRSFLRQDPDIILVGEIRDFETAAIAVKAALTGHLVLSTLHTNDAPSTVIRLIDMGIEPYLVSSAVKLVIAQRLLRKICTACREEVPTSEVQKLDLPTEIVEAIEKIFKGKGCEACHNIGNKGRMPIFEVMPVKSREMRRIITEGGTEVQVAQVAVKEGMITLAQASVSLVNEGIVSLDEAVSIMLSE